MDEIYKRVNIDDIVKAFYYITDPNRPMLGIGGNVTLIDSEGNEITSLGGGASGGGDTTYSTEQNDFTVSITDSTYNIVLSTDNVGGTTISEENFLNGSLKVYKASTEENITIALDDFNWTVGTKTLDITNCNGAFEFATGDLVSLSLNGPKKAYDTNQDVDKANVENPDWDHYTDPESLVSANDIGAVNDTWIDQGAEIDVRTYKTVPLWIVLTVSNSTGNQVQVLSKHTSAGSDEYVLATSGDFQKTLGDSDIKIMYPFNVEGIHYIQVQTKATALGITAAFMTGSVNHQPSFAVWEAITDGSFRITLNGTPYNIDGVDFTGISDLDGVASVAQAALRAATGDNDLTIIDGGSGFIFTANDDSASSITALDTSTGVVGTDISGFPKANNIWFDAYDTDGVVTAATGTEGTVTIDLTKEY